MITCTSLETPYQVSMTSGAFTATCDASPDKGGAGQGFRPHELLEGALGSCTAMVVRMYADNHGIPLAGVTVRVSLDRNHPDGAAFVCAIELAGQLTDEQREKLLRAAKACPVRRTLSRTLVFVEGAGR